MYDTFGRLQRLTYPDGEVLTYGYDSGGLVNKATGVKGRFSYPYLKRLDYDKFDQRVYLVSGNNIETSYTFNLQNRRLDALQAQLPKNNRGQTTVSSNTSTNTRKASSRSCRSTAPAPPRT